MQAGATKRERDEVLKKIKEFGYKPHVIHGTTKDVLGAVGSLFLRSSYPKDNVNSD